MRHPRASATLEGPTREPVFPSCPPGVASWLRPLSSSSATGSSSLVEHPCRRSYAGLLSTVCFSPGIRGHSFPGRHSVANSCFWFWTALGLIGGGQVKPHGEFAAKLSTAAEASSYGGREVSPQQPPSPTAGSDKKPPCPLAPPSPRPQAARIGQLVGGGALSNSFLNGQSGAWSLKADRKSDKAQALL